MPEPWTRDELIAAIRAEIERDGVHVEVTDDELWHAIASPLQEARLRALESLAALKIPAERASAALDRLADALHREDGQG